MVQILTDKELTDLLESKKNTNDMVMVDFFATWCGPCKRIAPHFESLAAQFSNIEFYKVDVDNATESAMKYDIEALPTFLLFRGGKPIERYIGAEPTKLTALLQLNKP